MTLGERIKLLRGEMAREKFAPLTGIVKNTLVNYETDASSPQAEYLNRLLGLFPDVNPAWLLTGEGMMQRNVANGHTANGNNIIQGAHIDAEDLHLTVHQVKEDQPSYEMLGVKTGGVKRKQVDPLVLAFIKDWLKLSDVGRMRVWTFLKEEHSKENPDLKLKTLSGDDVEEWDWENI